jgi:hypothetical protein
MLLFTSFCPKLACTIPTAGKKLKTKTFKSVTEFFKAQFNQNKNDGTLKCMELMSIKKRAYLKLKSKLCDKICTRADERCTYQAKRKLASCNTNAAHTMAVMSNIGTLIAIAIAIGPMRMNGKGQSALVWSAPAITTGRMTVATISLKS